MGRGARSCWTVVLVLLAVAVSGQSQPAQTGATPTFTARTELVLVPAVVTDHRGDHITGLTKDDFVVLENGVEQKIAAFEEVKPSAAPVPQLNATTKPTVFTNIRPANFQPRKINIIVFDALNTPFTDQAYARQQLIKYLSTSVQATDLTTLLVFSRTGIKVIHDFTTDTRVLIAALKRQKGQMAPNEAEDMSVIGTDPMSPNNIVAMDQRQVETEAERLSDLGEHAEAMAARMDLEFQIHATIDCMEDLAQAFTGIPGRKALIWITSSFPMMLEIPNEPWVSAYQQRRDRMFDDLNAANIAVYPVDARGLVAGGITAAQNIPHSVMRGGGPAMANMHNSMAQSLQASLDTLSDVADRTGGRAYFNTNDLAHAFQRADADSSAFYLLAYYVRSAEGKPGWRKLSVKAKRPGAQVRARTGYFFTRGSELPDEQRKQEIKAALASPFESTAVPMVIRWDEDAAPDKTAAAKLDKADKPEAASHTAKSDGDKSDKVIDFLLFIDPRTVTIDEGDNNRMSLDFVAVAMTPELKSAGVVNQEFRAHLKPETLAKMRATGITYHNQFKIPPGDYTVKFVVRDNLNGRVGSLTTPLKVD